MIILDISTGEEEVIQERKEREQEQEEEWEQWYERNHSTQLQLEVVQ